MKKIIAFIAITLFAGCTLFESDVKTAGAAFVDCTKGDIASVVATILADVASAVEAGGSGWEASLETIGKTSGSDALACAVKSVETVLAGPGSAAPLAAEMNPGAVRAASWLDGHGIRFK